MNATDLLTDATLFSRVRLFDQVRLDDVLPYLDSCPVRRLAPGQLLLSPDQSRRSLFVLVDGQLEVRRAPDDRELLARLQRGDCVGELCAIDDQSPIAWVVAATHSRVIEVSHDTLWALVGASHGVARNLLRIISGRIRQDNRAIADSAVVARHFRRRSVTDALTGLHNRRWMDVTFSREIGRALHDGAPATLLLLDVDRFSDINSECGHLVGDHVLRQVAERLQAVARPDDLLARYGGDEFAVLLPATGAGRADELGSRLCAAMTDVGVGEMGQLKVSVSVGIGELAPGDSLATLLRKADRALYRAKAAGRDRASR